MNEEQYTDLKNKVDAIHKMIVGNGEPEKGMAFKVGRNTDFRLFLQRFGWLIAIGITGAPFTLFTFFISKMIEGRMGV